MAHDVALTVGKPAMAYFRETPWHRLGTELDNPATSAEGIEAVGLNYRAELLSLVTEHGISVPNRKAMNYYVNTKPALRAAATGRKVRVEDTEAEGNSEGPDGRT